MRVCWVVRLFLASLCVYPISAKKPKGLPNRPLYVQVPYAGICKDNPSENTSFENLTLVYQGTKCLVSGVANIYRDITAITQAVFTLHKCPNAVEEHACELFQTWRFGRETCMLVDQKNMIWSPIFQAFHPHLHCPIPKGQYKLQNATVDTKLVQDVFGPSLLEKGFWRVRIDVINEKLFTCIAFGVRFLRGKS